MIAEVARAVDLAVKNKDYDALRGIYDMLQDAPDVGIATVTERGKPETLSGLVGHIELVMSAFGEDIIPPPLDAMKAEPKLFQPTQLAPRVETPGVIVPPRRVLTPQPTALATVKKWERIKREEGPSPGGPLLTPEAFAIQKWSNYYAAARAADLGFSPYIADPELKGWTDDIYKGMAKKQQKFSEKHQTKIKRSRHPDVFNPWISARHAFATLGERTGVPLWHLYDRMMRNAGTAWIAGYEAMGEIKLHHLTGLTPKDNKDIAWYLFSPKTRAAVIDDMSGDAVFLAEKLNDILQGPAAKDVQEMVFRRWVWSGKAPKDVKLYGDPKKIMEEGLRAKAEGRLTEWIAEQPPWGVRQFYYMSDPAKHDIVDDYLERLSLRALHKPQVTGEPMPGTISYEAHVRRGKPPIKEGSVVTNVLTHMQRIKIANAIADDYELMQSRLNEIDLSNSDRQTIARIFSNLMMKRQIVGSPWKQAIGVKRWFWRTRLSPLANPEDVVWMCCRQALQNFAMGPTAINLREAAKTALGDGRLVSAGQSRETSLVTFHNVELFIESSCCKILVTLLRSSVTVPLLRKLLRCLSVLVVRMLGLMNILTDWLFGGRKLG
jgi:hypothetical protein